MLVGGSRQSAAPCAASDVTLTAALSPGDDHAMRTRSRQGSRPEHRRSATRRRVAEVAGRLLSDLRCTVVARTTLSCATLLAGSEVKNVAAANLLGERIAPNALKHRL